MKLFFLENITNISTARETACRKYVYLFIHPQQISKAQYI